jgi:MFS family permease
VDDTEVTTAATDLVLALAAWGGRRYLRRLTPRSERRGVWLAALGCFALGALLGAIAHGVAMTPRVRWWLWHPLYLLLGVAVALFVVGAVADWKGWAAARRLLPPMLGAALLFYAATMLLEGKFLVFVVFQAAALGFSMAVYLWLAVARGVRGAVLVAVALGLSLAAGAVQASPTWHARLIWELDHNGLFHLVQLAGLLVLLPGLRAVLQSRATVAP